MISYAWRRKLTYGTIGFYNICGGIEYSVIFPTIWAYLRYLGSTDETYLGLAFAAYNVATLLAAPLIGIWFDKTRNAKLILIVMNLFGIAGGLLYFFALQPWFLVLSRFVGGLSGSAIIAILADVTRSTAIEERTSTMSILQASRGIGLLMGPIFNLVLQEFNFELGHFPINKLTAPGIFMAAIGIIMQILFFTTYFNLGTLDLYQKLEERMQYDYDEHHGYSSSSSIINGDLFDCDSEGGTFVGHHHYFGSDSLGWTFVGQHHYLRGSGLGCRPIHDSSIESSPGPSHRFNDIMEGAEGFMAPLCQREDCCWKHSINDISVQEAFSETSSSESYLASDTSCKCCNSPYNYTACKNEFLRDEVVILLGLTFQSIFSQMVLETIITPLTQRFYGFGAFENSLMFLLAGIEVLIVYLAINFISKKLQDRTLILVGCILGIFSLSWCLVAVPIFAFVLASSASKLSKPISTDSHSLTENWNSLPFFIVGVFIFLLGISLTVTCSISLFSKIVSKEKQGMGHGIRAILLGTGMILGPMWGGSTTSMPIVLFGIPLLLSILFTVMFAFSFSKLKVQDSTLIERPIRAPRHSPQYHVY